MSVTCITPTRAAYSATSATASPRAHAATPVIAASSTAPISRASARSPSPNRHDSESWVPSSPIHLLVLAPAPSASSLDTSPFAPSYTPSVSASWPVTSPVEQLLSPTAEASRPSVEIVPGRDAVAIVVEPTTYRVIGYNGLTQPLARRIVAVDAAGVIADWRVQCDADPLLVHDDPFNPPDSEAMRRLPLKTYTEALRGLSQLLVCRYMVLYDRDATLDALRLSLPIKRTTDIGKNKPIRNRALRFGGTCWCRSRSTVVELDMLCGPNFGGLVPDDLVARACGILQLFQRIADPIPHPKTSDAVTWIPWIDWFSRPDVYELATSIMLEKHKSRRGTKSVRAVCDQLYLVGRTSLRNRQRHYTSGSRARMSLFIGS